MGRSGNEVSTVIFAGPKFSQGEGGGDAGCGQEWVAPEGKCCTTILSYNIAS